MTQSMNDYAIRKDDLTSNATRELLSEHFNAMRAGSPPGHSFSLDLSGLREPAVTVWSAWDGEQISGVAALKQLNDAVGELKSMRTAKAYLRKGVAAALLDHIVIVARERGLDCLSLETGSGANFAAAVAFYRNYGFVDGEAFADYVRSDFNQFLHLSL